MCVTGSINYQGLQRVTVEEMLMAMRSVLLEAGPFVSGSIHTERQRRVDINGWDVGVFATPSFE